MSVTEFLESTPLFRGLRQPQLEKVISLTQTHHFAPQTTVFQEGHALENLYLVEKGSVRLTTGVRLWSGNMTLRSLVSIIGPGGVFGWSALIEPYTATLRAETEGEAMIVTIDAVSLKELMDKDEKIGYRVMSALARVIGARLRALQEGVSLEKATDLRHAPVKEILYS